MIKKTLAQKFFNVFNHNINKFDIFAVNFGNNIAIDNSQS